ncbi:MAG TPA: response regulator [Beijerinckiaceae bacterium]|jgi:DNA-binding response OmpR family regulator|nr:response regulator [Beijerinckiaceae bacterium]
MSNAPVVLLVEGDVVIRHPLAEYLRECGFVVFEAADGDEAISMLDAPDRDIDVVLADMTTPGSGFALHQWITTNRPSVDVIMAGSVDKACEKAGDLCNDGPALVKPYEHRLVLDRIRRAIAQRGKGGSRAQAVSRRA